MSELIERLSHVHRVFSRAHSKQITMTVWSSDVEAIDDALKALRSAATPAPGYAQGFEACREELRKYGSPPYSLVAIEAAFNAIAALPAPAGVENVAIKSIDPEFIKMAVHNALHDAGGQCWPICETYDDNGLDEGQYIEFLFDVLNRLSTILAKPAQEGQGS